MISGPKVAEMIEHESAKWRRYPPTDFVRGAIRAFEFCVALIWQEHLERGRLPEAKPFKWDHARMRRTLEMTVKFIQAGSKKLAVKTLNQMIEKGERLVP